MTAPATRVHHVTANALVDRVAMERQALRTRFIGTLALVGAAAVAVVFALGAWLLAESRWLLLPRGVPILIWLAGAGLAAGAVYWLRRREGDKQSVKAIAAEIENEQGLRRGSLRGALEVGSQGVFGAHAAQMVAAKLPQSTTLVPKVHGKLVQRLVMAGGAAVVAVLLLVVSARTAKDGFAAVVHPVAAWRGLLLPALGFPGLPASVPRGMPLTLKISAEGRSTITLSRRAPGEAWADTILPVDAKTGLALLALGPVRAPIALRATDGRAPAAEITLSIGDRGWVGDVSMQAIYPAYLGRTNETIEAVSPLRVPRGTVLVVTAEQHGGARDAVMSSGRDTVRFVATDDSVKVEARFTADHDGTWHWTAGAALRAASVGASTGGSMLPEVPEDLALVIAPDAVPQVAILSPMSDTAIGTSGTLPLAFEALDDHGVTKVMLTVWREAAADVGKVGRVADVKREQLLVAQPDGPVWGGQGGLPLAAQNLEPGDRLHLVAVATDNSLWHQQGQSAELVLRVPSLAEQRSLARSLGDSLAAQAQRMASAEKKLQQSTSDASRQRDLKNGGGTGEQSNGEKSDAAKSKESTMSFAAAERAKQVARDQRDLSAKIDSMRASAKEMEQRLKDAGALDTALANRMKEVQKMLRDAMTPEMQKQLQNLESASDRLSGTEAQKSMEQLAAQQQQMREQLEKSAEMLKRAALEGTMETLRDEARDLADAQQKLADKQSGKQSSKPNSSNNKQAAGNKSAAGEKGAPQEMSAKEMAERTKDLEKEVEALAKKLEQQGAKPGAEHARQAERNLEQGADAAEKAAKEAGADQKQQNGDAQKSGQQDPNKDDPMAKAMGAQQGQSQKPGEQGKQDAQKSGGQQQGGQQQGQQGGQQGQQGGQQQGQQGGQPRSGGQQGGGQQGSSAQQAADAMDRAADQLAQARESQVDAWKNDLSQQLDQSINETMQLAKQQASLEDRMKKQGASAQSMQGEQGAIQQGVQQAAQRLEQAGRQSSLLSQRSQKAMADAAKRSEQATKAAGQPGGSEAAQNAMKDATEALNQALSSLVKDREKVNSAESASGFSEMMEQLKKLGQQQGNLNSQMQGLNMLPGGAQGQQAQQQARVLAKQQREVARSLSDVSDADASGRMEELAKEAQQVAQAIERGGPDPQVAARQAQLYRRLLDAGKFLEQDEKDDEGPREAKSGDMSLSKAPADGAQSGKAANKFLAPTWNELRGLGAEERRLVLEYFRRLNSKP